ncbi:MAG TPA: acyl-CoA dehydrogenase C-terminal domain-containing protein [Euzebyales bacterium]|nr:acyl-CoA dehydrogenase C-terminal domain-containing protein [Euzebyales bacterium]
MLGAMVGFLMSSDPNAENGDIRNVYKVGQNTTRLLLATGDLVVAWLVIRQAAVALDKLGGDLPASDQSFYEGNVAAAQFFARQVLPKLSAERAIAETTDNTLMELDEAAL